MSTPADVGEHGARTDIQALRGVAVLAVLLYHAKLAGIQNGYLGVDMFFVNLTALERYEYFQQLLGAVTYTANLVLWQQSDYFNTDAGLKPLLHVWSLSLEEQFCLLVPLLLLLLAPRRWLPVVTIAALASALACFYFAAREPAATFYLLPTRAWELLLGSALAAMTLRGGAPGAWRNVEVLASRLAPALSLLTLWAVWVGFAEVHPGIDAVVVCSATAALIAARPAWANRGVAARLLARVGDASYSLYLIHWPILALALSANLTRPLSLAARCSAVLAAAVLATLCYRWIEQPFRRLRPTNTRFVGTMIACSGLLLLTPMIYAQFRAPGDDWAQLRGAGVGFDWRCDYDRSFDNLPECRNAEQPEVLVWGDSTAMHWIPGLAAAGLTLTQATKSVCGPNLSIAPLSTQYQPVWARKCLAFNASVLDFLSHQQSLRYVILASTFTGYGDQVWADGEATQRDLAQLVESFAATIQELRRLGLRVVLMAPLPMPGIDLGRCLEYSARGSSVADADLGPDCSFEQALDQRRNAFAHTLLEQLAIAADVDVIWPAQALCHDGRCRSRLDGVPIYRDSLHLTQLGSVQLVRALQARQSILSRAR